MAKRYFGSAYEVVGDEATNPKNMEVSEWDSFPRGIHHRRVDNRDFTPCVHANSDALVIGCEGNIRLHSASRH